MGRDQSWENFEGKKSHTSSIIFVIDIITFTFMKPWKEQKWPSLLCQRPVPSLSVHSPVPCHFVGPKSDHCLLLPVTPDSCDMTWKQLLWWPWVPWTHGSNVPLAVFSINGQIMVFCDWADWICHFISAFPDLRFVKKFTRPKISG